MFALSSRFSTTSFFRDIPAKLRGAAFADQAYTLYCDFLQMIGDKTPTLEHLQGLILLAYYYVADRPNTSTWLLVGLCCRILHQLEYHLVDLDVITDGAAAQASLSTAEWVERESRRRAYWSLCEIDWFTSALTGRPPALGLTRSRVLLPVSDHYWFSEQPLPSAPLLSRPEMAWRSLYDSPNQDERAWFLISESFLTSCIHMRQSDMLSAQAKLNLEMALNSFESSLPEHFRLGCFECLAFDDANFAKMNWIISTHLVIQAYIPSLLPNTVGPNG